MDAIRGLYHGLILARFGCNGCDSPGSPCAESKISGPDGHMAEQLPLSSQVL